MIVFFKKDIDRKCSIENIKHISGLDFVPFNFDENYIGIHILSDVDEKFIYDSIDGIKDIVHVDKPYKFVSRDFKKEDTIVHIGDVKIGGEYFETIGGPCSFENEYMFMEIAKSLKELGVNIIRGGAFKPRTSPYFFQGIGKYALISMRKITSDLGLKLVSEIVSTEDIEFFNEYVDVFQVGARNMQNFELLKKLGECNKPVLLKRGLSATIEEFLLSAEYIVSKGNINVILCERGIRTFEKSTRNTLDISAVPLVKKLSHLPIIVDPSHASGQFDLVEPLALASVSAGCNGIMVEVHNDPENALSDGYQSIKFKRFDDMNKKIHKIRKSLF